MYADCAYYNMDYLLGKEPAIPDEIFAYWEKQARMELDALTFGRLQANPSLVSENVKDCICAIAELLYKADSLSEQAFQEGAAGLLSSYSNDGESGTFALDQSVYTESGKKAEIQRLVYKYLGRTGLLYAGMDPCRRCCHEP